MSWQPLWVTDTPTPLATVAEAMAHWGEVSGLSRNCARLTVWLVPAMRPSIVAGRSVASGGELVTRTRILKDSAPPRALTETAPVAPACAAGWACSTT